MNKTLAIMLVGGDMRQAYLCEMLRQDGYNVSVYGLDRHSFNREINVIKDAFEGFQKADIIILPMPVMQDNEKLNAPLSNAPHNFRTIVDAIDPNKFVLAGAVSQKAQDMLDSCNIKWVDYLQREELAILNAIPTSEGAIQIALEELPITLQGARCLVTGNGRVGKILSSKLKALGAKVKVSARKQKDFAYIYSQGMEFIPTENLQNFVGDFDLIINTVPEKIFSQAVLARVNDECLIIDLASKPGGVDFEAATQMARKVIWALSLPGKVAPITAAEAVKKTVYNILEERGLISGNG